MPWISRNTTIAAQIAQNSSPRNQANASPIRSLSRQDALDSCGPVRLPATVAALARRRQLTGAHAVAPPTLK